MATQKPAAKPAAKTTPPAPKREVANELVDDSKGTTSELQTIGGDPNLPAFLQGRVNAPARGAENVSMDDLVIPRLELVQALSPCLKEKDPAYIEGAKAGMLFNNVTRELYGNSAEVIPVYFKKEFIVWKDRKKGGGFEGAFMSPEEAEECREAMENPDDYRVNDTANHFCLLRNKHTSKLEEIVVSMAVTKLKVSRQWNSLQRINGGDSFTRAYVLSGVEDKNKAGEEYNNFAVKNLGYVTEFEYKQAEALYETVKTGLVIVNRDEEVGGESSGSASDNSTNEY
jgi:hypothetical protein